MSTELVNQMKTKVALTGVTDALLNDMCNFIPDEATVADHASKLNFEGYDPADILAKVLVLAAGKTALEVKGHLTVVIVFGLTRGFGGSKQWTTIIERTNAAGKETLRKARAFFDLKLGNPADKTDLTVARIMQAFPLPVYHTYLILAKLNFVKSTVDALSLPLSLQYIGSPAVMDSATWTAYREDYVAFSVNNSKLWNKTQDKDVAARFADLAYNSSTCHATKRIPLLKVRADSEDIRNSRAASTSDESDADFEKSLVNMTEDEKKAALAKRKAKGTRSTS